MKEQVQMELSDKQGLWCCCGELAMGFHEINCAKFQQKVIAETVKRLQQKYPHVIDTEQ